MSFLVQKLCHLSNVFSLWKHIWYNFPQQDYLVVETQEHSYTWFIYMCKHFYLKKKSFWNDNDTSIWIVVTFKYNAVHFSIV